VRRDRFVAGLICCGIAAALLVFGSGRATTGAVAFGVLGIAMIAISRRG
jgi:hypothetical protein